MGNETTSMNARSSQRCRSRSIGGAWVVATIALASVLGFASVASAQCATPPSGICQGNGFNLQLFRPAVDSKGQFAVNGTDILGHLDVAFGLIVDYGYGQARLGTRGTGSTYETFALADHLLTGTFIGNVGLANWLVIGLAVPFQLAFGPAGNLINDQYAQPTTGLSYQNIGNVALNVKFRALRAERTRFGLAAILTTTLNFTPGGPRNFVGEPQSGDVGTTLWPHLVLEWRPVRWFRLDLDLGFRYSTGTGSTLTVPPSMEGGMPSSVQYGIPITAGLGFSFRVSQAVDIVFEAYSNLYTSAFSGAFTPAAFPIEGAGGLKIFVERNSYLMLGAGTRIPIGNAPAAANVRAFVGFIFEPSIGDTDGDGYRDDVDRCPSRPEDFDGFEDQDGCPEPDNDRDGILDERDQCPNTPEDRDGDHDDDGCPEGDEGDRDGDRILDRVDQCPDDPEDRDGFQDQDGCPDRDNDNDGVLDTDDLCPNDPEDRDGFEDANGCPDPDNDHDRIPDTRDRCPNEPETYNGNEDQDGCPDQGQVVVEEGQIRILQAINFETDSARIRPDSIPIVEAVARTLVGNPQITLVQVQGHADERGNDDHNLRLTQDRAAAVVEALVERSVARDRLHSAGFGELCRAGYPRTPGQPELNAACQGAGTPPRWCHSDRAWHHDRRVVFLILRTTDGPTGVRIVCDEAVDLIPQEDRQYHNVHPGS